MKIFKIFFTLCLLLCITSCGTLISSKPYNVPARLQIEMDDLVFLGEVEISCQYDTYLGFCKHINFVNDEIYVPGASNQLSLPQGTMQFSDKGMNLAAAKCLKEYPEARYFQVVMDSKQTDKLFLASSTVRIAKVRCYKFK